MSRIVGPSPGTATNSNKLSLIYRTAATAIKECQLIVNLTFIATEPIGA